MFFLIIFVVYFLTNPILNDKIKKLLKTIKGLTIKNHIRPVVELVKPMNLVVWVSTRNL
jgi:hypothetical protein